MTNVQQHIQSLEDEIKRLRAELDSRRKSDLLQAAAKIHAASYSTEKDGFTLMQEESINEAFELEVLIVNRLITEKQNNG